MGNNELFSKGLQVELDLDIGERVVNHRNRFYRILKNRYIELLPSLIFANNVEKTAIDNIKMEVALRFFGNAVVGETKEGKIGFLGFIKNMQTIENPLNFFALNNLKKEDIYFTIPKSLRCDEYDEITTLNDCTTGNFVVLKNKTLYLTSDLEIIEHYASELAEITTSRFSLSLQSKITTFFKSERGDETINKIVTDLYNGKPYIKTSNFFDPEEQMITFENGNLSSNFTELKREYQNKLSELNTLLAVPSLGVDKESGVSEIEAKSSNPLTTSIGNIYLYARQKPFDKLKKRYKNGKGLETVVFKYDNQVAQQINALGNEVVNSEKNNQLNEPNSKRTN